MRVIRSDGQPSRVGGNINWDPLTFQGTPKLVGIKIGEIAEFNRETDTATFDWPVIEAASSDPAHPSYAFARLFLAAREEGRRTP